jgi:hypothetical protein
MFHHIVDLAGTAILAVVYLPLRAVAARRYVMPNFTALGDKVGLHILTSHYYEPTYREADLPTVTTVERSLPAVDLNVPGQLALLERFTFQQELLDIPMVKPGETEYGYSARMYGPGDAEMAYNMIRLYKPKLIIEIGSGDSTLIAGRAIAANIGDDADYGCHQICVEPYEKPWLESIGVEVHRERVEKVDLKIFEKLDSGDILFIDSSHVIRPWGDVLREFHEIIPSLKPGVLVHIHDIYTPNDYPEPWLRKQRRLWNEQYLLESYLSFNARVEVMCAANWLKRNHFDAFAKACPVQGRLPGHEPGAFWFVTR